MNYAHHTALGLRQVVPVLFDVTANGQNCTQPPNYDSLFWPTMTQL